MSKRQGELALAADGGSLSWIIFRPPAVYGPEDQALLPLFQWIRRGIGLQLGTSSARFSLLYVDDLVEAVSMWLEKGTHAGQAFELHDGQPGGYDWKEVCEIVRDGFVVRLMIPEFALSIVAILNESLGRLFQYQPMLTCGKVRELRYHDWVCDNTPLANLIGWRPSIMLKEGVERTLQAHEVA